MANYCNTNVKISGEPKDLKRLFEKIGETTNFHTESYSELFESVDDVDDWGSKWQVMYTEYCSEDTMLFITGESAWSPADGLWKKISKDYNVEVVLEYSEPGMGFAGITSWNDGDEVGREEMSYWSFLYETDNDYFWDEIEYKCECFTLEELIDDLGEVYEDMDSSEKERILEVHSKNYID
jgi:hypothetical protein